jgi:pentapeptide MXKDX repeat protein
MKNALIATCVAGLAFVSAGAAFAQTDTTPKKEEAPMAKDAMGHDKMAKEGMKNDKMKHDGMKKDAMKHDEMKKDGMKKDEMKQ